MYSVAAGVTEAECTDASGADGVAGVGPGLLPSQVGRGEVWPESDAASIQGTPMPTCGLPARRRQPSPAARHFCR